MQTYETARLLMRPLRAADEAFYCACYTDPVLMEHIGEPFTHAAALRSFHSTLKTTTANPIRHYTWAMQEKTSGETVGLQAMYCDQAMPEPVTATLGTIMLARFQNRGYTAEALKELSNVVYGTSSLDALFVKHKKGNDAVAGVMKKLGYLLDATNPEIATSCLWVLRRAHWLELRNATA